MPATTGDVVFLDLDGCLVDSSVAIPTAMNAALSDLGLPAVPDEVIHRLIGPPLEQFAPQLLERVGGSPTQAETFARAYLSRYAERMVEESRAYDGIPEAMRALSRIARLVVVTLKRQALAQELLIGLDLAQDIELVVGASGAEADKTPLLVRAVDMTRPGRSVMVGDQPDDMAAAGRCGIAAVGVSWGFGATTDLIAAGATTIVDRPADLRPSIETLWVR
jgi:phosphoglycolate phosphatase